MRRRVGYWPVADLSSERRQVCFREASRTVQFELPKAAFDPNQKLIERNQVLLGGIGTRNGFFAIGFYTTSGALGNVHVSTHCNFRCLGCRVRSSRGSQPLGRHLDRGTNQKLDFRISSLHRVRTTDCCLFGRHPRIREFLVSSPFQLGVFTDRVRLSDFLCAGALCSSTRVSSRKVAGR